MWRFGISVILIDLSGPWICKKLAVEDKSTGENVLRHSGLAVKYRRREIYTFTNAFKQVGISPPLWIFRVFFSQHTGSPRFRQPAYADLDCKDQGVGATIVARSLRIFISWSIGRTADTQPADEAGASHPDSKIDRGVMISKD